MFLTNRSPKLKRPKKNHFWPLLLFSSQTSTYFLNPNLKINGKKTKWKQKQYLQNLWKHNCTLHNTVCNPWNIQKNQSHNYQHVFSKSKCHEKLNVTFINVYHLERHHEKYAVVLKQFREPNTFSSLNHPLGYAPTSQA